MRDIRRKPEFEDNPNPVTMPGIQRWARKGSWCVTLGITLISLGILAITLIRFTNFDTVPLLTWLIVLGGVAEAVHAFHLRKSGDFFFHLVPGITGIPLGLLMITHPDAGAVAWMLVFASFFTVVGLFRLLSAVRLKFPSWQWAVFDAVVTLVLACLFWTTSKWFGQWFFDLAVGTSLILRGWSSIAFGLAVRGSGRTAQTRLNSSKRVEDPGHTAAATRRFERLS
jgi:uncharacterized membrane protein HdeD (DUF308 family)